MSDEFGYDRRDNSALYNKIDTLETKLFENLDSVKRDMVGVNLQLDRLNYKVSIFVGVAKWFAGVVGLALLGAILRMVIVR